MLRAREDAAKEAAEAEEKEQQVLALEAAARDALARGDQAGYQQATKEADELRAIAVKERAEAAQAQAEAEAAASEQEARRLKAQISEAKRAVQSAKEELSEWDAVNKEIDNTMLAVIKLTKEGDKAAAAKEKAKLDGLQERAAKELGQAKQAGQAANSELLETVTHEVESATNELDRSEAAVGRTKQLGQGPEIVRQASMRLRKAKEEVESAGVRAKEYKAQAALQACDLEVREAAVLLRQGLQATAIVRAEVESGVGNKGEADAGKLMERAVAEMKDAHEKVDGAMPLAFAAAEERKAVAKRQYEEVAQLIEAEGGGGGTSPRAALHELLEENRQELHYATFGQQVCALEMDCLQGEIEMQKRSMEQYHFDQEKEVMRKRTSMKAMNEAKEREIAEALALEAEEAAEAAAAAATAATAAVEEIAKTKTRKSPEMKEAEEAEAAAQAEAKALKEEAVEKRAKAEKEKTEAQEAEMSKFESRADDAWKRYQELDYQVRCVATARTSRGLPPSPPAPHALRSARPSTVTLRLPLVPSPVCAPHAALSGLTRPPRASPVCSLRRRGAGRRARRSRWRPPKAPTYPSWPPARRCRRASCTRASSGSSMRWASRCGRRSSR